MKQAEFREAALRELREITGSDDLPPVFLVGAPRPLANRIRDALIARYPDAKPWKLSRWLRRWCARLSYRKSVANGRGRFDLDNRMVGPVTNVERDHARQELDRRRTKEKTVGKNGRPILRLPSRSAA